jgi:Ca2+/H+ antiporter
MFGENRAVLKRTLIALVLSLALGFAGLHLVAGGAVLRSETYRVQSPSISVMVLIVAAFLGRWLSPAVRIGLLCNKAGNELPNAYTWIFATAGPSKR